MNNENNEDIEVAKLLQCWRIMPFLDAGETVDGETEWWILGPSNKVLEPSISGPFTREEAFATALEHNKAYSVNAVYVHGKDENGETVGDFEEPSEGDFEKPPRTPFEQAAMEVGDYAVKKVLADLRNEAKPKRNRKPKEEEVADTTTYGSCPYCGQNLTNTAVCKHFVVSLGDDDGGGDWVTPLYYAFTEHHNESHDNMIECLDGYFEALCGLCDQVVKRGADEAKRILSEAKRLPRAERAILTQAVQLLDHLGGSEDYETPQELLRDELPSQLKTFFTELFRQARGKPMATDWIIQGGLEWTYTDYWAEDAEKCIRCIIQQSRKATDRLRKIVRK